MESTEIENALYWSFSRWMFQVSELTPEPCSCSLGGEGCWGSGDGCLKITFAVRCV